ncbi:MAG: hypothetical protein CL678_07600 [Bdellovibrionaceae bacterium]|nr:hypothetical protein [Pseudobdellovibrionaceae bacterium]|tara:strand:- start:3309 stop:4742 length:1434 start_codon:yes stop_codon:yes gene_type:complete
MNARRVSGYGAIVCASAAILIIVTVALLGDRIVFDRHYAGPSHLHAAPPLEAVDVPAIKVAGVDRRKLDADGDLELMGTVVFDGIEYVAELEGRGLTAGIGGKNSYKIKLDDKAKLIAGQEEKTKHYTLRSAKYDPLVLRDGFAQTAWAFISSACGVTTDYMAHQHVELEWNGEHLGLYLLITSPKDSVLPAFDDDTMLMVRYEDGQIEDKTKSDYSESLSAKEMRALFLDTTIDPGTINAPSFAAEFLMAELTRDRDVHRRSMYMYYNGSQVHFGPQWDFDAALGNFGFQSVGYSRPSGWAMSQSHFDAHPWFHAQGRRPDMVAHFATEIQTCWQAVNRSAITTAAANAVVARAESIADNRKRWGAYDGFFSAGLFVAARNNNDAGGYALPSARSASRQALDFTEYVERRIAWMDGHIHEVRSDKPTRLKIRGFGPITIVVIVLLSLTGILSALFVVYATNTYINPVSTEEHLLFM